MLFNNQFLLTKKDVNNIEFQGFNKQKVNNYNLFSHPNLTFCKTKNDDFQLILLGDVYSYENPGFNNQEILNELVKNSNNFITLIKLSDKLCGQYIIIYYTNDELKIVNDAGAQREVFYDINFNIIGSQPNIIGNVIGLKEYKNTKANTFYKSLEFNKNRVFLGEETNYENIFSLTPNFYLDLIQEKQIRFFPYQKRKKIPKAIGIKIATKMLKGFLQSISNRNEITIPITAGWDSRVILAASAEINTDCFVFKHKQVTDGHYDILIPNEISKLLGKPFRVIEYEKEVSQEIVK